MTWLQGVVGNRTACNPGMCVTVDGGGGISGIDEVDLIVEVFSSTI